MCTREISQYPLRVCLRYRVSVNVRTSHLGRVSVLLDTVGGDLGGRVAVLCALRVRTLLVHRGLLVVGLGLACIGMKVRISVHFTGLAFRLPPEIAPGRQRFPAATEMQDL